MMAKNITFLLFLENHNSLIQLYLITNLHYDYNNYRHWRRECRYHVRCGGTRLVSRGLEENYEIQHDKQQLNARSENARY